MRLSAQPHREQSRRLYIQPYRRICIYAVIIRYATHIEVTWSLACRSRGHQVLNMENVLGLEHVPGWGTQSQNLSRFDRMRALFLLAEMLSRGEITSDWSTPVDCEEVLHNAANHCDSQGFSCVAEDDFINVLRVMQTVFRLSYGSTEGGDEELISWRTMRPTVEVHSLDKEAVDSELTALLLTLRDEGGNRRQVQVSNGEQFMMHPNAMLSRHLSRSGRVERAQNRSASGKRAVGDAAQFTSTVGGSEGEGPQITLSGHAQEFMDWCCAEGGTIYNGVTLEDAKEKLVPNPFPNPFPNPNRTLTRTRTLREGTLRLRVATRSTST